MSDEDKFNMALEKAARFQLIDCKVIIMHAVEPGRTLEIDNLAQDGYTVFIFEGKSKKEDSAVRQLKERYESLTQHKEVHINKGLLETSKK